MLRRVPLKRTSRGGVWEEGGRWKKRSGEGVKSRHEPYKHNFALIKVIAHASRARLRAAFTRYKAYTSAQSRDVAFTFEGKTRLRATKVMVIATDGQSQPQRSINFTPPSPFRRPPLCRPSQTIQSEPIYRANRKIECATSQDRIHLAPGGHFSLFARPPPPAPPAPPPAPRQAAYDGERVAQTRLPAMEALLAFDRLQKKQDRQ
ncbi:hypothetical protein EVAR_76420_1 [Eumeta japonica]|uniref:Uncharacterized protein n=1 Tax=Eumeta variegata TaxID=151549 RepID=A0A4C1T848_EUMVA|nr:hypothetical protein EVAR_76420_1 [Eumeta japonica]